MAGEHILLVEDQRAVAGALKMRLRGLGYEVMAVASDGLEAIQKAVDLQPDLILMDVVLGEGMDGIETAHQIRSRVDIPVVYVSAYANQKLLDRARETRPAGFINKPFTTKDLLTTLDLALHRQSVEAPAALSAADAGVEIDRREAIITADLEGRVSYMNRAAEKQTGWKRGQVIGRSITELLATLYGLQETEAQEIVRRLTTEGGDEKLSRTIEIGRGGVQTVTDNLTPLLDAHGQNFGLALRFRLDTVNRSMADLSQLVKAYTRVIDAVPIGVLLVNEDLKVLHMNERGREIIAHNRGLDCRNDQLIAHDKQLNRKLQDMVTAAATRSEDGEADSSDAMFVKTPFLREPIEMVVTPVGGTDDVTNGPSVIIYLFDTGTHRTASNEILTQLYGLTQTEAKLVQVLVQGRTLDDAAGDLGISVNTARTHLKHVFHKTGINRQTELIHRIETGPAGLLLNFDNGQEPVPTSRK